MTAETSCPSCSALLKRGAVICTSCGLDLRTGRRISLHEEANDQDESTLSFPAMLVICVICFVAYFAIAGVVGPSDEVVGRWHPPVYSIDPNTARYREKALAPLRTAVVWPPLAQFVCFCVLPAILVRWQGKREGLSGKGLGDGFLRRELILPTPDWRHLGSVLAIALAASMLIPQVGHLVATSWGPDEFNRKLFAYLISSEASFVAFWSLTVIAACNEVFFRGLLLRTLSAQLPLWATVVVSAGAYSFIFPEAYLKAAAFVFGLALALLTVYTGTAWYSILCHVIVNIVGVMIARDLAGSDDSSDVVMPAVLTLSAVAVIAAIVRTYIRSRGISRSWSGRVASVLAVACMLVAWGVFKSGNQPQDSDGRTTRSARQATPAAAVILSSFRPGDLREMLSRE